MRPLWRAIASGAAGDRRADDLHASCARLAANAGVDSPWASNQRGRADVGADSP